MCCVVGSQMSFTVVTLGGEVLGLFR